MKSLILRIYISAALLLSAFCAAAQGSVYFQHYGAEDGLPQNTVMDMLQDRKGVMWFSTWDGLCKFDGYRFTSYKNMPVNLYPMRSNRIDHIREDKQGYIWTLSYDREAHRFDPRTGTFMGIRSLAGYENFAFKCRDIITMPSGRVWLLSNDKGCIAVDDTGDGFAIDIFDIASGRLADQHINCVFEDSSGATWILTDDGATAWSPAGEKLRSLPSGFGRHFHTAAQIGDEVWLGSDKGSIFIYNLTGGQFRTFDIDCDLPVTGIKPLDRSDVLITTGGAMMMIYDTKNDTLKRFEIPGGAGASIVSSYVDRSGRVWLELKRLGVTMFDPTDETIVSFAYRGESPIVNVTAPRFFVLEDQKNNVWVQPKGGGFSLFDARQKRLTPFYNRPGSSDWRFSGMLHCAFVDRQNNLWLSTHSEGLEKAVFSDDAFRTTIVDPAAPKSMNNSVRCVFEDNGYNLWVSTKDGRVHFYDRDRKYHGWLSADGSIGRAAPLEGITYTMMQDKRGDIWLGTKGEGLYRLTPGRQRVYSVTNYRHDPHDINSLNNNNIYSTFEDDRGRIWIASYGGGLNLLTDDGRFVNHGNRLTNYPMEHGSQARTIAQDKFGNICVGTTLGLIMFPGDFASYDAIDFRFYIKQAGSSLSLTANDVYDIVTTRDGQTYFATFGGGVNTIAEVGNDGFPARFAAITTRDGLSSDIALQLAEDSQGKVWISSEGDISVFNPADGTIKTYSEIYKIIRGYSFTEGSKCVSHTGMIHFGYTNGLLTVNPGIAQKNEYVPYVALTNLQISNKDAGVGLGSPLPTNIDDADRLRLSHKQNSFNIEFAAIDYTDTRQIQYAYMLDGFDTDWIAAKGQRTATYNNLAPGKYRFMVRSTNSDGVWTDNRRELPIEITPSFWQTLFARFLYVIATALLLYAVLRSLFIYFRLKDKMQLEKEDSEMRTRFFMDISHEIRTPLTMVVSPIENLIEGDHTQSEVKTQLGLVLKNANRMLRMVNQILDFRKIEKNKLNIQKTLFGEFIEEICRSNFAKTAEMQGVDLVVKNDAPHALLWIDRDNVEKLLFNLLSNAFKYTPAGKTIEVRIFLRGHNVALVVRDQGRGMPKEVQNKLFTRFASFSMDKSKPSTGIGLSIVKEVADKHKARIEVESDPAKGSCFTVIFQSGHEHFEENAVEISADDTPAAENATPPEMAITVETSRSDLMTVLVVEDDIDLRQYIVDVLQKAGYKVIEAGDGEEGYAAALARTPDFIMSDIMMPRMDGVEFLQKIKSNVATSHIPFILLTAKTNMESRLEGLQYGADDYITKPFSVSYLKARIRNILEQRRLLYLSFLNPTAAAPPPPAAENVTVTGEDQTFLKKVIGFVEENIDNSDFVVEDIAGQMFMSRTVLFKKMKSLTGMAPVEFIREVKIKRAARMLLEDPNITIKEAAFMVGISDTKYFTKWFKTIIGSTPSEYRKSEQ